MIIIYKQWKQITAIIQISIAMKLNDCYLFSINNTLAIKQIYNQ